MNSLLLQHGVLRSDVDTLRDVVANLQSTLGQQTDLNVPLTTATTDDGNDHDKLKAHCDKRLDEHKEHVQNFLNDLVKRFEALEAVMQSLGKRIEHRSKKSKGFCIAM